MVYCHSQTGSRVEGLFLLNLCAERRYNLLLFDFPGCGKSEGEYISLGWFEPLHLENIIQDLRRRHAVNSIGLWGRSMGAVTCIRLAERNSQEIRAMVLDSPFSDLEELVKRIGKVNLRVPQIMMSMVIKMMSSPIQKRLGIDLFSLRPIDSAKHCTVPAFFIAGSNDQIVPESTVVELYKRYKSKRKVIAYSKEGHSNEREAPLLFQGMNMISEEFQQSAPIEGPKQNSLKLAAGGPFFDPFLEKHEGLEDESSLQEKTLFKLEESTRDKIDSWHLGKSGVSNERSVRHEFSKTLDLSSIDSRSNLHIGTRGSFRVLGSHQEMSDLPRTQLKIEQNLNELFRVRDHSREGPTTSHLEPNPSLLPARPPLNGRPPMPSTPGIKPYKNLVISEHISRIRDTSKDRIDTKPAPDVYAPRSASGAHPRNRSINFIDQNHVENVLQSRAKDVFSSPLNVPFSPSKYNYGIPAQPPGSPTSREHHTLRNQSGGSGMDLLHNMNINSTMTSRNDPKPQSAGFFKYRPQTNQPDPHFHPQTEAKSYVRLTPNNPGYQPQHSERRIFHHHTDSFLTNKVSSPTNVFDHRNTKQTESHNRREPNAYIGQIFRRPSQS